MLSAGYRQVELKKILMSNDYKSFKDASQLLIGQYVNLVRRNGVFKGDEFYKYIKHLLAEKGINTFKDLRDPNAEGKRFTYRFQCMASDITSGSLLSLPADLPEYGLDPDEFEVAMAVRNVLSIPIFFQTQDPENKLA